VYVGGGTHSKTQKYFQKFSKKFGIVIPLPYLSYMITEDLLLQRGYTKLEGHIIREGSLGTWRDPMDKYLLVISKPFDGRSSVRLILPIAPNKENIVLDIPSIATIDDLDYTLYWLIEEDKSHLL